MASNTPQEMAQNATRRMADALANPLRIPREQSPVEFESMLKRLASTEGLARIQLRIFFGCACLVASLGSALMASIGIPTLIGGNLAAIGVILAYFLLRKTPWLLWIGGRLRETSVFRAQFLPSMLKQTEALSGSTEDPSSKLSAGRILGLSLLQTIQVVAWLAAWIACAWVARGAPNAGAVPFRCLALLGLATLFAVRVATVLVVLLRVTAAIFGGILVGTAVVVFGYFWPASGAGGTVALYPLFVATVGLGAVWSLSLINHMISDMYFVNMAERDGSRAHFQTPDLGVVSKYLNPILFTIHAPDSTVMVLRRISEVSYCFHDAKLPISPIESAYDIYDLSAGIWVANAGCETGAAYALGAGAKAERKRDVLELNIRYACKPKSPSSDEMARPLDGLAVGRFNEVFFHGQGLAEVISPIMSAAAKKWFATHLLNDFAALRSQMENLRDRAKTLLVADRKTEQARLEDLTPEDVIGDGGAHMPDSASTTDELNLGRLRRAEKIVFAVRNSLDDLRQKIDRFQGELAGKSLAALQECFDAELYAQFANSGANAAGASIADSGEPLARAQESVDVYRRSYKTLVSILSLRIADLTVPEFSDMLDKIDQTRTELIESFNRSQASYEATMTRGEDRVHDFKKEVLTHLEGEMTAEEVLNMMDAAGRPRGAPPKGAVKPSGSERDSSPRAGYKPKT